MKKPASQSAKATPKPSAVYNFSKNVTAKQNPAATSSARQNSESAVKLVDKWPNIKSAACWIRQEKEREIRENLAKMAGITIGTPQSAAKSTLPKSLKA